MVILSAADIRSLDVQISRLHQAVTGLLLLAETSDEMGKSDEAVELSQRARNLTIEQFRLTQSRDDSIVESDEWKGLTAALDVLSASIGESMKDINKVNTTIGQIDDVIKRIDGLLTPLVDG